ncbi:MAG: ATP-binding protein [Myxococcota bacterium]|nr:ATP-binding protein [Myxococcota bacterium]
MDASPGSAQPPPTSPPPTRRWDLLGAAAGLLLGASDTALLLAFGVRWSVGGQDATWLVGGWFGASFAVLGFLAGRLAMARARARRDAWTIRAQAEALEASRRAAFENEKLAAIGQLAAGIAHEVRNPLGVIRSSASMVQEAFEEGDDAHRACGFICEEIDRLEGLIASLLAFARPVELQRKVVPAGALVDRALRVAGPELARRGAAVEREEHADARVHADPDLAAQVLIDLLANAAEALEGGPEAGGGRRVAVRSVAEEERVLFEVADDGPGVPPAAEGRLFEPFFTTRARGTGLGLAMASRIAQAHGGELVHRPGRGLGVAGRGACFRLALPRAAAGRAS